ncbi:MAG: hypothetical protein V1735_07735 [Nanoarchaeota archaeon]
MNLRPFREYRNAGVVKPQTPDRERAAALIEEAVEKRQFLSLTEKSIPQGKMSPNFVVDYCYDILLEMIRAKMHLDGLNAGTSHQAEVAYLEELDFSPDEVRFLDEMRYYRNGTKYYGTLLTDAYANKVRAFQEALFPRLKALCQAQASHR